MYSLTRALPWQRLVAQQAPALIISLVIAELFYKFGSFSLECVAFLATWFVFDFVSSKASDAFRDRE